MIDSNDPPAVPLWVNGHVFLTMAPMFQDIRKPSDGRVLRRTPLCDGTVVDGVVEAARNAGDSWRVLSCAERVGLCQRLAQELARYTDHFRKFLAEEADETEAEAEIEVLGALEILRKPPEATSPNEPPVVAIIGQADAPLLGALRLAVAALMTGAAVVIKPDPATPSALVALGELTGRCGFPPGVFNVVHGGDAVVARLRELNDVGLWFS
ncbi:MAG: aldehyde dehydrogenase family protein [Propionivibrio sp.]